MTLFDFLFSEKENIAPEELKERVEKSVILFTFEDINQNFSCKITQQEKEDSLIGGCDLQVLFFTSKRKIFLMQIKNDEFTINVWVNGVNLDGVDLLMDVDIQLSTETFQERFK